MIDDFETKSVQGWNMLRRSGEQANLSNPEMIQDLASQADVTKRLLRKVLVNLIWGNRKQLFAASVLLWLP